MLVENIHRYFGDAVVGIAPVNGLDKRLADFLLAEAALEGTNSLRITHEAIGNHMGSAREVITRMLRYFQSEGMVRLTRGVVEITDEQKLRSLRDTK